MTTAQELIAKAEALLLDFDGPVTALMPPPLNAQAAERARAPLEGLELPGDIKSTTDHLAVLGFTAEHYPARLLAIEQSCTEAEIACARESQPSPEIRALIGDAEERSIPVAVVSNNSEAAVRAFLERFEWARRVRTLSCRTPADVGRMKPDPYLVVQAARHVGADPSACVFIGDSVSDVIAGRAAGVSVVGLAKTKQRGVELSDAGAHALLERTTM